jgi:pyrimidine-nucleoside phosphorylase
MQSVQYSKAGLLIRNFLSDNSEINMTDLINHVIKNDLNDNEIVLLAKGLAESGATFSFQDDIICDIPSTGGPASLTTLICPLFLKLLGCKILKLGVPGRPAGGIDVLSQIEGFNNNPNSDEVKKWLDESRYVHILANDSFTPADAILFEFRKRNSALNIPSLVIASLLSKKLAVGLKSLGLDVRVSEFGNFGATDDEAKENCLRFNKISSLLGINSKCFITNGNLPQQPFIGRGEALLAFKYFFFNIENAYLKKHISQCLSMALSLSPGRIINFSYTDIKNCFFENIEIQGGKIKSFFEIIENVEANHIYTITSSKSGFLSIDLLKIRNTIVKIQNSYNHIQFPDPCGIILKRMPSEFVQKGEIICTLRCEGGFSNNFIRDINSAVYIYDNNLTSVIDTISHGKI